MPGRTARVTRSTTRSEEHTSELQSHSDLHSFPTRRSSDLRRSSSTSAMASTLTDGLVDRRGDARPDRAGYEEHDQHRHRTADDDRAEAHVVGELALHDR